MAMNALTPREALLRDHASLRGAQSRHASILPYTARRLRSLVVPLLCVALAARAEAIGPTVITRVDDLIDAPRALFGRTRAQVERTLGEPQELTEGRYLYLYSDGYPDTVEVYFRDHRVYRIEWNYWTE